MARMESLRRIQHLRTLREQQSFAELEAAVQEAARMEAGVERAAGEQHEGREASYRGASTGSALDRTAGLVQEAIARRTLEAMQEQFEEANDAALEAREDYLALRMERRQVEELISAEKTRREAVIERRTVQEGEDAHRARLARQKAASDRKPSASN